MPPVACFAQGWGIAGLLFMSIGAWHITSARLEADPRPGALRRSHVLSLGRHARPPLHIIAPHAILERLEQDLRREAARMGAPLIG